MNEYLGVIIGGLIGFLSAFLIDFVRARREQKRWRSESSHQFFRKLSDKLATFLSAHLKIIVSLLQDGPTVMSVSALKKHVRGLSKEEQKRVSSDLSKVLQELVEAHFDLMNKGYIALFPSDIGFTFRKFEISIIELNKSLKEKGLANKDTEDKLGEVLTIAERIRKRIRQLLNVDALD